MYKCMYPIRATEIPLIKRNRLKELKTIIGEDQDIETQPFELTNTEFLMMASMYQTNLGYLVHFLDLAIKHGGMVVCISYVLLTGMLGMPLFMLFTFMSSYSKKSYLTFWDCVPLFEGLGYTLATVRLTTELYNIVACSLSFMMISDLFQPKVMQMLKYCKYNDTECIPMYPTKKFTKKCNATDYDFDNKTLVATQYYVRNEGMQFKYTQVYASWEINTRWLMYVSFTWLLIFACAILGIKRIRKITVNLQLIFAVILIAVVVIGIFQFNHEDKMSFLEEKGTGPLMKFNFWVDMILHSTETNVLSNMIWLGTLKPRNLNPKYAAIITSPIKLIILIGMVCITSMYTQEVLNHYKIVDHNCLLVGGFDVIFVFIPDVMHRTNIFTLLNLFWYLGISYFGFIAPLYTVIGLVDSIIQRFTGLRCYRMYVYLVLCICGYMLTSILVLKFGVFIINTWKYYSLPVLTSALLLIVNLAICFVYSIKNVIDDYTFTYGNPPEKYWTVLWKASPIFSIFAFIFMLHNLKGAKNMSKHATILLVVSYCQCLSVLFPIFGILITRCCKHIKYKTLRSLSKPGSDWGPYLSTIKEAKKYFYPHRDIKRRNPVLKCNHRCAILNNYEYDQEILKQNKKLEALRTEFQNLIERN